MKRLSDVQAKIGEMMGEVRERKAKRPRTSEFAVEWEENGKWKSCIFHAQREGGVNDAENRALAFAKGKRDAGSAVEVYYRPHGLAEGERIG